MSGIKLMKAYALGALTPCLAALFLFAPLCCSAPVREETKVQRVRCLSMRSVFGYLAGDDEESKKIVARRAELRRQTAGLEDQIKQGGGDVPEPVLRNDLRRLGAELREVEKAEERLRGRYYNTINRAVAAVARRMNVDFVFNIGEEVVYSRRDDDITELVIQELSSMKNRNAPHAR